MHIGIFDSGIGGEIVAEAIQDYFPAAKLTVVNDKAHLPYGDKTAMEIIRLTDKAIQPLIKERCDVIVIACNSATTAAIDWLRKTYPTQRFIGIEPMVKPASQLTKSHVIAVCATPATLNSHRYERLRENYGAGLAILEPDCSQWAQMIEKNNINLEKIKHVVNDVIHQGADVIVLGCTHYHWIKNYIESVAAGKATVIEPSNAICVRIKTLLTVDSLLR